MRKKGALSRSRISWMCFVLLTMWGIRRRSCICFAQFTCWHAMLNAQPLSDALSASFRPIGRRDVILPLCTVHTLHEVLKCQQPCSMEWASRTYVQQCHGSRLVRHKVLPLWHVRLLLGGCARGRDPGLVKVVTGSVGVNFLCTKSAYSGHYAPTCPCVM